MKTPLYQKIIPKSIRLGLLKNKIIKHLESVSLNEEETEVLEFLKNNPLAIFPYQFPEKYKASEIVVEKDEAKNLLFTIWENKRLYYKNGHQVKKAQTYFNSLLLEQDVLSPHRYLTPQFDVNNGDVIVDVGAAEGNFSLSVIEKASFVYLFEVEKEWIKALEATFEPWKEKIKIVQKYVSDVDNEDCVKLDTFFDTNQQINFIKADVEGAEGLILTGGKKLIGRQKDLRIAICTYHRQSDAKILEEMLKKQSFKTHFSDKFMIFYYGKTNVMEAPYLRKAVLRGVRFAS